MDISTASDNVDYYVVTLASGLILYVPKDSLNADYIRVQEWALAGGTIT